MTEPASRLHPDQAEQEEAVPEENPAGMVDKENDSGGQAAVFPSTADNYRFFETRIRTV